DDVWGGGMSPYFAEGCCQHYGLPTNLVDFSSSLGVALSFARPTTHLGKPNHEAAAGGVAVLDLSVYSGIEYPDILLADLTSHPWSRRPRRQAAFGVLARGEVGHAPDLKAPHTCAQLGISWFTFRQASRSDGRALRALDIAHVPGLLDAQDDVMA